MKDISHLPADIAVHFHKCETCGLFMDMRDLGDLLSHEHGKDLPDVSAAPGKPVHPFNWGWENPPVNVPLSYYADSAWCLIRVAGKTGIASCN